MSEPINKTISPWMPETNQIKLAVLGKLVEECNELSGRAARSIIQGLDENDPSTGRTNREELEREIADVEACIAIAKLNLQLLVSLDRLVDKQSGFLRWHEMIEEQSQ
jgi:hypothetical protein